MFNFKFSIFFGFFHFFLLGQIDFYFFLVCNFILPQLSNAYDVYLPTINDQVDVKDTELTDYMTTFFPRQSTMKFNASRSNRHNFPLFYYHLVLYLFSL